MHDISFPRRTMLMQADLGRKVGELATPDMLVMDETSCVAEAVKAMKKKDFSSVLVSHKGTKELVGIITERDILYKVVAENKGPFKTTLKEIMSTPLITVDESATVLEATLIMRNKGIRRLPVKRKGEIIGLLTLMSIVGNMPGKSIEAGLIETGVGANITCPYCGSGFESKQDLSKHVDRLHIGSGLLEGDLRQI
ncbi:CBS and zinc finger C2H2 domain-containing protein [Nitrososphaera viennensis EN76]|uniref:CBS and zinc finger C2H2 domain-containing protein n=2 Tax=Nitrososphaera viennensis TaxID=1034015 RepID=A0A060HG60_9ARCH|nr:CBS and zinc finger C2H2 domain-containing protein [Nitrososphaera viennensis EN76]